MRIYTSSYELMSETMRNCIEMGAIVRPKSYQNKNIEGQEDYITKEVICHQYCLTSLGDPKWLFLADKRSKQWVEEEFKERIHDPLDSPDKFSHINPGSAFLIREDVWKPFLVNGKFDYTYNERLRFGWTDSKGINHQDRIWDALKAVRDELIRNPDTRQAVIPIFHPTDVKYIGGERRVPCSMYYDFLIREIKGKKRLHICYHQRSSDLVTHFGNDVYLAWKLMEYMADQTGNEPGYLYHTIDSLHSYKKDWVLLKQCLDDITE